MSCTTEEQKALHASGCVPELVEVYEDALVSGLDADSHRTRNETGILLSNLASGDDGAMRSDIIAEGGEEALDEALQSGEALDGLDPLQLVEKLEATPHHGGLLVAACDQFHTCIERSLMSPMASQAQTAMDLINAGALRTVALGLRRHAHSDAAASAALSLLAALCRWQPIGALHLNAAHAIQPVLTILKRGLDHNRPNVMLAACDLLHALSVDQAVMPPLSKSSTIPLDLQDALPLLTRAAMLPTKPTASDGGEKGKKTDEERVSTMTIRHAQQAISWLAVRFPKEAIWAELLKGGASEAEAIQASLIVTLTPDCSILSAESLARAIHASPSHAQLLTNGCFELRKQLIRRHRGLGTNRFLGLQLVEILLSSVKGIEKGEALGTAATDELKSASASAVGSILALCAALSNAETGLTALKESGGLETLLPWMLATEPPPQALLNGALLLANALRLRSDKGTLEQQLEEERRREKAEADGTLEAQEKERAALLEASLPVLLRIVDTPSNFEADALASALDALRKLAASEQAVNALLRHEALPRAIKLLSSWPAGTPPLVALDACELIRLLLLAASAAAATEDGAPVAAQAGDSGLATILSWVTTTSDAHPIPDEFTDEEKLQRTLCQLLCTCLSAPPLDAALGHSELEGLKPLLYLMKTQRNDAELSADGASSLKGLCIKSVQLTKQVAKLGAVKTLLLTMRQHIKSVDVNLHSTGVLRAISEASDGCRKLVVEAHGVPMLCAVMKRHSLEPDLQRDGVGALASLMLNSPAGMAAVAKEKEGVEVLCGGMLICAREKLDFAKGQEALQKLAELQPDLIKRIGMANGKKYLKVEKKADGENGEGGEGGGEEGVTVGAPAA